MVNIPKNKKIILFDGICNLCNNAVLKIIKNDKKNLFLFASIQSNIGKQIINSLKIDTFKTDSIIVYEPGISYEIKSSAVLSITKHFKGFWMLTQLLWFFPKSLRDWVYDYIAKNRYKWFGKKESCLLPTQNLKAKFLEYYGISERC